MAINFQDVKFNSTIEKNIQSINLMKNTIPSSQILSTKQ